jgi:hypothetical protein
MVEMCTTAKLKAGNGGQKTADWERSIKEAEVRIGL